MSDSLHTAQLVKGFIEAQPQKVWDSWRCSSIGQCMRSHFYKRKGVEPTNPPDDRVRRVFAAGDIFHDFIENITKKQAEKEGWVVSAEEELYDEKLDLGGRYDLLLEKDDFRQLRDIKTQHSGMFHHLQREARVDSDDPEVRQKAVNDAFREKYNHQVMQLGAYMVLLKDAGKPVDEGVIVRVSKDDLSLMEVHFKLDTNLETAVRDELTLLNKHWAENTLPPCTCGDTAWGTAYCDFADKSSEKYVDITSKSGKTYKRKQLTACCAEELFNPPKEELKELDE